MKILKLFLILFIAIGLLNCPPPNGSLPYGNGDDTDTVDTNGEISFNLSNAHSLLIGSSQTAKAASSVEKLYKITDSGEVVEIDTEDSNPVAIIDSEDSDYLIVTFGYDKWNPEKSYLVRKSDSLSTQINSRLPVIFDNGDIKLRRDNNNFYYRTYKSEGDSHVIKLTLSGSVSIYSPILEGVLDYNIDSKGNMIYTGRIDPMKTELFNKIMMKNGEFVDIDSVKLYYGRGMGAAFVGFDNLMYYLSPNEMMIKKVTIDNEYNVIITDYVKLDNMVDSYLIYLKNAERIYRISYDSLGSLYEVYNNSYTPDKDAYYLWIKHPYTPLLDDPKCIDNSDNYIYVAGLLGSKTRVLKFDPTTRISSYIYNSVDYDIIEIAVTKREKVTVGAIRLSDGVSLVATIDSGILNILKENINITDLEAIK